MCYIPSWMSLVDEARTVRQRIADRLAELEPLVREYEELKQLGCRDGPRAECLGAWVRVGARAATPLDASAATRQPAQAGGANDQAAAGDLATRVVDAVTAAPGKTVAEYAARPRRRADGALPAGPAADDVRRDRQARAAAIPGTLLHADEAAWPPRAWPARGRCTAASSSRRGRARSAVSSVAWPCRIARVDDLVDPADDRLGRQSRRSKSVRLGLGATSQQVGELPHHVVAPLDCVRPGGEHLDDQHVRVARIVGEEREERR